MCKIDISRIDWKELRSQKEVLVRLTQSIRHDNDAKEALEGIIHLIDHIQDKAAEELGEKTIFDFEV